MNDKENRPTEEILPKQPEEIKHNSSTVVNEETPKERKPRKPSKDLEERFSILEDINQGLQDRLETLTKGLNKAKNIKSPKDDNRSFLDDINDMLFS